MTFVDQVQIFVQAGHGGDGACSFRREKFVPRGGPDGGDGGQGGHIVFTASARLTTLLDLRYQQRYVAKPGRPGEGGNRHGKSAPDVTIRVPVGTMIFDDQAGDLLADLTADGQSCMVARGGRGGHGNSHFATPTNQVPTQVELGTTGEERCLRLELKLLANVGLVGLPNAGKSTLIAAISAARPKIADYPFTTLVPNLGVVTWGEDRSFVVADIPGLIEGAHAGKGLGDRFLRHVERTSFLLHVVDISEWGTEDPVQGLEITRQELAAYDQSLTAKPYAVVPSKVDIKVDGQRLARLQAYCDQRQLACFPVSAATGEGLQLLIQFVGSQVERLRSACATSF
ncbi:MAG: GTPase ObgE [Nitrospirales bacterium]